ncbi:unnamed protein product, partial [Plutella xylostella]
CWGHRHRVKELRGYTHKQLTDRYTDVCNSFPPSLS